jgi:serine/threonine protein kinase HipA of HipAB toxin-antitoxin module
LQQQSLKIVTFFGDYYWAKNSQKKASEILACALNYALLLVEVFQVEAETEIEVEAEIEAEVDEPS